MTVTFGRFGGICVQNSSRCEYFCLTGAFRVKKLTAKGDIKEDDRLAFTGPRNGNARCHFIVYQRGCEDVSCYGCAFLVV